MHELELLLDWHHMELPAVVLQQLESELLDKPPSICLGNRVYLPGDHQAPGTSRFVRATSTARLLIEEADGSSRWVSRAGAKLDVYAEPLSMEDEFELLMGEILIDPEEPPRTADTIKIIEYRAPTKAEIAEDFDLLRRLLHTGGLFSRATSSR